MTAAKHLGPVSVEEYLKGESKSHCRHEYSGGHIYMMAGGTNAHNRIATLFLIAVGKRLTGQTCQPFNSDTKVRCETKSKIRFYYPDAMVVCEPNAPTETFQDRPTVVAEVLSLMTRRIDEGEKLDAYLTIPSLSSYLLIEQTRPTVTVYRRTGDGFVAERYDGIDAVIPLDAIGIKLPLSELYDRVDFTAAVADEAIAYHDRHS